MQSSENPNDELQRLDDLANQIKLWRQQALRDADGVDDIALANYVSGSLDEGSRRDIDAKLAGSPELREIVEIVESVVADGAWEAETDVPMFKLRPPIRQHTEAEPLVSPTRRVLTMRTNFWMTTLAAMAASVLLFCIPVYLSMRSAGLRMVALRKAEDVELDANAMVALREAESARAAAEHARNAAKSAEQEAVAQRLYSSDMRLSAKLPERDKLISSLAFSPDGAILATGSQDGRVRIWDVNGFEFQYMVEDATRLGGNRRGPRFNREAYDRIYENPFLLVRDNPLSTFSIDVDTAAYSNARRFLTQGRLPPKDAIRIEEFINYFTYDYAPPQDDAPFAVRVQIAPCPWQSQHKLAKIGLKGNTVEPGQRPPVNLVFLLDVSGSMKPANKLPLLKSSMSTLVEHLDDRDRVGIVVYAGASGLVLPPTSCEEKGTIQAALDNLNAGGSTAGGEGIQLAYQVAAENYEPESVNRVILCTDGDFNVGITDRGELTRLIEDKAKTGVFLSVLGFGVGNYKDSTLEKLADKGNGNYAYIDTALEANKVLIEQMEGTLVTIAKDVKIQVDFNPTQFGAYRLIGYENRMLRAEDFRDDTKDAGEIGAGHTVTAIYQLIPTELTPEVGPQLKSKYLKSAEPSKAAISDELLTVSLRYKQPEGETSKELSFPITTADQHEEAPPEFKFAAAVACFGMLLRDSAHKGESTYELVLDLAEEGRGEDVSGYRDEFVDLVKKADSLTQKAVHEEEE